MRTLLKQLAERALVGMGAAAVGRALRRRDVLILAYHNVLPPGERPSGDTSLHLPHAEFTRQIEALARTHEIVPLSSILDESPAGPRPRAVMTFDDAYVGALRVAVPELVRRRIPATIFVAPGLLGTQTWWDALADEDVGAVPPAVRDRALTELAGEGEAILAWKPAAAQLPAVSSLRIGTEADLIAAAQPGITFGSHTWSHANLAALSPDALHRQLRASMDWLRERFSNFTPWLSYPYGLYSPSVERAAADVGYAGALRVDGGWHRSSPGRSAHALPRYNVPAGLSTDGFRLRLGGIGAR
jgi:peptidoglycan/xylan/chitin deacetylase (PgdA/CDA1 family)